MKKVDENKAMVNSQTKEIKHHADELSKVLGKHKNIESWVVGKIERASTDLSDVTHYLDGKKYAKGGGVDDVSELEAKQLLIKLKESGKIPILRIGNHGQVFMAIKGGHLKSYDNYKDAYAHYHKTQYAKGGNIGGFCYSIGGL